MGLIEAKEYMESKEWIDLSDEYKKYKDMETLAKAKLAELKADMLELTHNNPAEGNGISISITAGRATTDYKQFLEDQEVIIPSRYTKIGKSSMTVRVLKEPK